ncbi:hypothetical protein K469DRAFT_717476 [Zopfia rhizophila CBS 207.26]|uniref:Uncharacterized protein n=1 Tax=Zopfia rhizophila CBS 207.26 TaxID=1314779 RepID=A0A6A6DMM7_9PEZI|nr:hypothetical protein K469DRAFT_717476 [Zopfia rhizophila CBS 207.26]
MAAEAGCWCCITCVFGCGAGFREASREGVGGARVFAYVRCEKGRGVLVVDSREWSGSFRV